MHGLEAAASKSAFDVAGAVKYRVNRHRITGAVEHDDLGSSGEEDEWSRRKIGPLMADSGVIREAAKGFEEV